MNAQLIKLRSFVLTTLKKNNNCLQLNQSCSADNIGILVIFPAHEKAVWNKQQ